MQKHNKTATKTTQKQNKIRTTKSKPNRNQNIKSKQMFWKKSTWQMPRFYSIFIGPINLKRNKTQYLFHVCRHHWSRPQALLSKRKSWNCAGSWPFCDGGNIFDGPCRCSCDLSLWCQLCLCWLVFGGIVCRRFTTALLWGDHRPWSGVRFMVVRCMALCCWVLPCDSCAFACRHTPMHSVMSYVCSLYQMGASFTKWNFFHLLTLIEVYNNLSFLSKQNKLYRIRNGERV